MQRIDLTPGLALTICHLKQCVRNWLAVTALGLVTIITASQAQVRKTILVVNEFGQTSPVSVLVTNQIRSALHSDRRFQGEFYWENLDAIDLSNDALDEQHVWVAKRYVGQKLDLIVLVGPDPIRLLANRVAAILPRYPSRFLLHRSRSTCATRR